MTAGNWQAKRARGGRRYGGAVLLAVDSVQPAFRLPAWDPSVAASAGASFAGVLGALLLATTFQIAITKRWDNEHRLNSVASAPITLLLLLIAAYLYVVLSGTTRISSAIVTDDSGRAVSLIEACQSSAALPPCAPFAVPAAMFAIAGSYLGLGAITLGFVLRLVVDDYENAKVSRDSTLIFFWAGSVVSFSALLWGYRDATSVFARRNLSVPDYLWDERGLFWALASLGFGFTVGVFAYSLKSSKTSRRLTGLFLIAYLTGPVLWYLRVQGTDTYQLQLPPGASLMTQAMLAWVAFGYGVCIAVLFVRWQLVTSGQSGEPAARSSPQAATTGTELDSEGVLAGTTSPASDQRNQAPAPRPSSSSRR